MGDRCAIVGYSQGGHGALWAGQLAAEWAPDLELVGTFAGAPATELAIIVRAAGMLPIVGLPVHDRRRVRGGLPRRADAVRGAHPAGEAASVGGRRGLHRRRDRPVRRPTATALLKPDRLTAEPWAAWPREHPGHVSTEAPILIMHSAADDTVPAALSQLLFDRMCDGGQVVERRVYEGPGPREPCPTPMNDGLAWIATAWPARPGVHLPLGPRPTALRSVQPRSGVRPEPLWPPEVRGHSGPGARP